MASTTIDIALQLYGSLILTMLGFVLPILTILLSIFSDGTTSLSAKYENEKKQSKQNILSETNKKLENQVDYSVIQKTLATFQKRIRRAETRLGYLKPLTVAIKISAPFFVSFIGVIVATQVINIPLAITLCISLIAFGYGIYAVGITFSVLAEVFDITNETKRNTDNKIIELLSALVEKSGVENLFLAPNEIRANFNMKFLKDGLTFDFSVNRKYEIPISVNNSGDKMAKKVEVGLIFPEGFLIEKTPNLSIFPDKETQIIRFNSEIVQAHENYLKGKMSVTFLKVGEFQIDTFIKGENVKYQKFNFKIRVIE